MQYRYDRRKEPISLLGYGCMRFTKKGGSIDYDKAEKELMTAIDAGVNYFDTAYIYPGSEACIGEIFEKNGVRERIKIATKLPQYMVKNEKAPDKYFSEQLSRLRTDYIDYYLMHMLTDIKAWENLKELGIEKWINDKKKSGQIRQIGFSFHGNTEMFTEILDAYDWDFTQIQYNYLDEVSQAGVKGLKKAAQKGIPVIIMEPLRGGKLVDMLPDKAKALIDADPKGRTAAELAFRWLWEQPEVSCVLSGMNSVDMVKENVRIASEVKEHEFDDEDFALIDNIRDIINEQTIVGCTGCGYCMPCPQGVDIPGAFRYLNETAISDKHSARFEYAQFAGIRKDPALPTQCIGCGKCESHCPQSIPIREKLNKAGKVLLPLPYRAGIAFARRFVLR